ncbi:TetR/AcrR family transcriptional regulator [Aeromicrobium sp. Leaf350]|uniref:TetR/AcrR family transcriptional regulator n=1 Tax=Aeromicrobium sp. Leaf350 TaxID=2876565 RepID=UPI001E50AFA4|nr:TetR/AcrR family transcriptional regulator [Aeromicrobium sp. Leaf350]
MPRISAADRRSDFVKAAVEVIAEHGIDGATTRRIAEQANAPLATLHYCYNSKEDLFGDVYTFVAERFKEVAVTSDPHGDVPETARQLLRGVMECYLESENFAATTLELVSWARRQHGDKGIGVYDEALEILRQLLRTADSADELDDNGVDEIAYVIATLADGFALNWLTYGDPSAAQEQMAVVTSVLDSWLSARLSPVGAS